jgi:hypothetical protein
MTELKAARPPPGRLERPSGGAGGDPTLTTPCRRSASTAGQPDEASLEVVAATMAEELGWDAERQREERRSLEGVWHG